jgi:hypothetical protein
MGPEYHNEILLHRNDKKSVIYKTRFYQKIYYLKKKQMAETIKKRRDSGGQF